MKEPISRPHRVDTGTIITPDPIAQALCMGEMCQVFHVGKSLGHNLYVSSSYWNVYNSVFES